MHGTTTKMADESRLRTVVLPVDKDEKSKLAVDWYCKKLHEEDDIVIIAHAHIAPKMYDIHIPWPAIKTIWEDWNYLNNMANKKATEFLEECQRICIANSVTVKTESLYVPFEELDKIRERICKFVRDQKADKIVMNYSSKGDKNAQLGSVCHYLVEHAGIPVEILYL